MKKRFPFVLSLFIPLSLVILGVYFVQKNDRVALDVWGVATDETQMALERTLLDAQRQFGPRVSLTLHYVAEKQGDGSLRSFQAGRLDGIATTQEFQAFDLDESKRRLVLQKYFVDQFLPYLWLQSRGQFRVAWEEVVRSLGLTPEKIASLVEAKGEILLREESERLFEFKEATSDVLTLLPILLIDGRRYEGAADFYSLSAAVTKRLLRGDREALTDKGGNVQGIRECYADFHCDDKPDMDGTCVDAGKDTARCAYATPLVIHATVLTPEKYAMAQDRGRTVLSRQFKGLTATDVARASAEGKVIEQRIEQLLSGTLRQAQGKKEKKLELPSDVPLYLLGRSLEQSPSFKQFVESGAVLAIPDLGYLVNPFSTEER